MSRFRRILRALFPATAHPVSIVATELEARALATLLASQGRRAIYHATANGFAVGVVA
ncbi:hypothetical protein [Chitinilyticum litopenaei]|uniref:hypothetical protein n=1 Tax=Chitinilyticum litopenaei TaxID=1121276 RepID=UPI00040D6291|nr:hypothetical protein [Chitinilyticum litopenaei]